MSPRGDATDVQGSERGWQVSTFRVRVSGDPMILFARGCERNRYTDVSTPTTVITAVCRMPGTCIQDVFVVRSFVKAYKPVNGPTNRKRIHPPMSTKIEANAALFAQSSTCVQSPPLLSGLLTSCRSSDEEACKPPVADHLID